MELIDLLLGVGVIALWMLTLTTLLLYLVNKANGKVATLGFTMAVVLILLLEN